MWDGGKRTSEVEGEEGKRMREGEGGREGGENKREGVGSN